jgi:hypothetical protein
MTAFDNPILMLLAWAGLAVAIFLAIKYFTFVKWVMILILGGWAVAFVVSLVISHVAPIIQDYQLNQKCLTAHERRERAAAAPDDYFGRQLRTAAAEEARNCADLAVRKEVARVSQK